MIKAALLYSLLASPTLLEGVDIHHPDGRIDTAMHIAFSGTKLSAYQKRSRSSRTLQLSTPAVRFLFRELSSQ